MPDQTKTRFGQLLRQLIEERQPEHLTAIGNVNLRSFAEQVEGYKYETIRKAAVGEREPTVALLEAVAKALDCEPETFYEYRLLEARRAFDPEEVGLDAALYNAELWTTAIRKEQQGKDRQASKGAGRKNLARADVIAHRLTPHVC